MAAAKSMNLKIADLAGTWDRERTGGSPLCLRRTSAGGAMDGKIPMSLNAVLKIGGSLSRGDGLEVLCREIRRLGERYRILVVPGGGEFADQVRTASARFKLSETTAHCMALCAMDQYGYLLNHLIAGSYRPRICLQPTGQRKLAKCRFCCLRRRFFNTAGCRIPGTLHPTLFRRG